MQYSADCHVLILVIMAPSSDNRRTPKLGKKKPAPKKNGLRAPKRETSTEKKVVKKKAAPKKPRRKSFFSLFNLTSLGLKWSLVFALWGVICAALIVLYYTYDMPNVENLKTVEKKPNITVTTADGTVIAKYGDLYGEYFTYDQFPKHLIQAVTAIEDRRFFEHFGIDVFGLARAAFVNFKAGHVIQGGSSITQQLAKILFLTPERTIKRKIQEMVLAFWLEHKFSKEDIITIYLNRVYMGSGNYGMSAAAHYYFGKDLRKINLTESAMLAGLLKAPSRFSPAANPERSKQRAQLVLASMVDAGFITPEKAQEEIRVRPPKLEDGVNEYQVQPYFSDWVIEQIPDYVGNVADNLTIRTTLDIHLQQTAEKVVKDVLDEYGEEMKTDQAAIVVIKPETGEIVAMVGGKDYYKSQFNRAAKAYRQPGSAFKTFVYTAAFEQGYTPYSVMEDSPIIIKDWAPKNYSGEYLGQVSLMQAYALSINTVAVKLLEAVGYYNVISTAYRMGIDSPIQPHPSMALGTNEVTVLEMTRAYAVIANNGNSVNSYGILDIKDSHGDIIYERQPSESYRVISETANSYMTMLMQGVVNSGTGRGAQLDDRPNAGKSGTSQEFRDAWFVGFTPDYAAGVWVGNDNNKPMKGVTGGKLPARIWRLTMQEAHKGLPARSFKLTINPEEIPNPLAEQREKEVEEKRTFWQRLFGTGKNTAPRDEFYPPTTNQVPATPPANTFPTEPAAPVAPSATPGSTSTEPTPAEQQERGVQYEYPRQRRN